MIPEESEHEEDPFEVDHGGSEESHGQAERYPRRSEESHEEPEWNQTRSEQSDMQPHRGQKGPHPTLGTVIWDFKGNDSDEISVEANRTVRILEQDDGSGWMKVRLGIDPGGMEGLIPAGYVKRQEAEASDSRSVQPTLRMPEPQLSPVVEAPTPPSTHQRTLQHWVKALWDYEASDADETSVTAGQRYLLTLRTGPDEEWWELIGDAGRAGLVPANHVQAVAS